MNPDADFNNIAEAFEGDIYGSSKGCIRLKVLPESARLPEKLDELLAVERALRREEPFASLGQHIHLVCSRV